MKAPRRSRPQGRVDALVQAGWAYRSFQGAVARHLGEVVPGRRVAVYGAGLSGQLLAATLETLGADCVMVVDGNSALVGTRMHGLVVQGVETLADASVHLDIVCIAASLPAATDAMRRRAEALLPAHVALHALTDFDYGGDGGGVPSETWPSADPWTVTPQPLPSDAAWARDLARLRPLRVHVTVVIATGRDAPKTLASIRQQWHRRWTALDAADTVIARGRGTPSMPGPVLELRVECPAGAVLPPWALFEWGMQAILWPAHLPVAFFLPGSSPDHPPLTVRLARTSASRRLPRRPPPATPLAFAPVRLPGTPLPRVAGRRGLPVVLNRAPLVLFEPAAVKRILVIKLDHIGDVVLSVPVIASVRARFPKAAITVITGSWAAALLDDVLVRPGVVDRVVPFDVFHEVSGHGRRPGDPALATALKAALGPEPFDLAIDLRRLADAREVLRATDARWKVAFGDEDAFSQLGIAGYGSRSRTHAPLHIVDQLDLLLRATLDHAPRQVPAYLPRPSDVRGRRLVPRSVANRRWVIAFAPGSGDQQRMWPARSYAALAARLSQDVGAGIVWVGSRHEEALIGGIEAMLPDRRFSVSLAGTLSLNEFRAAVSDCHLFIGNTTGPTHIAAATGVPTLNIFSGQVSPIEWAPRGPDAFVLWSKPSCAPCYLPAGACPYHRVCLTSITADDAFEAARRILLTTYGTLERAVPRG